VLFFFDASGLLSFILVEVSLDFREFFYGRARHNAARYAFCHFFAIPQRSNQEKKLGRSLRDLPSVPHCKSKDEI
jgi:hypothetical protein